MDRIVAVTGHRPDKLGGYHRVQDLTVFATRILSGLWTEGKVDVVLTGMALGWDQAIARACAFLRLPFDAYVPFPGQENRWPPDSVRLYHSLLGSARNVIYVSPAGYAAWKMQKRNETMIDACMYLLALWNGTSGGTANAVHYAESKNITILNVWPEWTKEKS